MATNSDVIMTSVVKTLKFKNFKKVFIYVLFCFFIIIILANLFLSFNKKLSC